MRMQISTAGKTASKEAGYTYIMLLVIAATMALAVSFLGSIIFSRVVQTEKEKELIFRGFEYTRALNSYYQASKGRKTYPKKLEYLLSDSRYPSKKHIRKLYNDPMTNGDWNIIVSTDGSITGVASKSEAKPLKQGGFQIELKQFEKANKYSDWIFSVR